MSRFRVGIDIGGTFTDFVLVDTLERRIHLGKRLTTHDNYLEAVLGGIGDVLGQAGITPADVDGIVHGTTLVTNTVIERKGARTALITTEGARDVIEIATEMRYNSYDLGIVRVEPLVPRHLRFEIPERMGADGSVLKALELSGVPAIVQALRKSGVRSVAVSLLHSYANSAHEHAVGDAIASIFPEAEITLSSVLVPEIREYERTSTAIVNAYVKPMAAQYLREMERQLKEHGIRSRLYLMLSNGGLAPVEEAVAAPVRLLESGPAGGAEAACFFGRLVNAPDLISFDMGGTTAKMCLINDGSPSRSHSFEAARIHRFSKGSGLPLRIPVIDMIEIGSGGGSIAHLDEMGLLKIGPESAGSNPGPACYGLGGTHPTVTDADVVLGYLDPEFFLGGAMPLTRAKSEQAIMRHVGEPMGMDAVAAAAGIQEIVNENMATATRLHVSERGRDLRRYAMLAFGGAGPVHAYRVAQLLGLDRLICPFAAGAASALGFLVAPLTVEQVRSYVAPLGAIDWEHLDNLYRDMEDSAANSLRALGVKDEEIDFVRTADMRFAGQGYEIESPMPGGRLDASRRAEVERCFVDAYCQLFDRALGNIPIEALSWRVRATGRRSEVEIEVTGQSGSATDALKGTRPVYYHDARGFLEARVYDRYRLRPGSTLEGPAVFEERESTVVVGPGARVEVDASLNLNVTLPIAKR